MCIRDRFSVGPPVLCNTVRSYREYCAGLTEDTVQSYGEYWQEGYGERGGAKSCIPLSLSLYYLVLLVLLVLPVLLVLLMYYLYYLSIILIFRALHVLFIILYYLYYMYYFCITCITRIIYIFVTCITCITCITFVLPVLLVLLVLHVLPARRLLFSEVVFSELDLLSILITLNKISKLVK